MVCHSSRVPFPCVLELGSRIHFNFVFVLFHRGAFSLSLDYHRLQYTDVQSISGLGAVLRT